VQTLMALANNEPARGSQLKDEEISLLVAGAPLWGTGMARIPTNLITALERVTAPSSLTLSLLVLALWRNGDIDKARERQEYIRTMAPDHPLQNIVLQTSGSGKSAAESIERERTTEAPPAQPVVVTRPATKRGKRDTTDREETGIADTEPAQTVEAMKARLRERAKPLANTCKEDYYGDVADASDCLLTLSFHINGSGKITSATPAGLAREDEIAKCLGKALINMELGPPEGLPSDFEVDFEF